VLTTDLPGLKLFNRGKVRDIYDLGDWLLIVATDRISAFDCVLPVGIPYKGQVLTAMSEFWFELTSDITSNHLVTTDLARMGHGLADHAGILASRSMLVKKTTPLPVECVIRGYLAGSGWKDYQRTGSVCGVKLPAGLMQSSRLPEPIFTPSSKAQSGHDENITQREVARRVGRELAEQLRERSLAVYNRAAEYALGRGLIIADTKFEWGLSGDELILIDEVLTPDSSRFWDAKAYKPGAEQMSFDKQDVRDWLERSGWNKQPPAPMLPPHVIDMASRQYREAMRRLTGKEMG
jgi:phosphoribosylaminoimidazole-succinocarboxamide synthase